MSQSILACLVVGIAGGVGAQATSWQPAAGHVQVALWPDADSSRRTVTDSESMAVAPGHVAGKPWRYVSNVSRPTLTVYSPAERNTGAAVVVFPGGGYQILAIDLEGTEACDWLTSIGVTCVLVKYRVPNTGPSWNQACGCNLATQSSQPLEDAQRAIGLVRLHAAEWKINPHKIGVLGFSAGGHLVAAVSTRCDRRAYAVVDAADRESCRPDFAVALYPGHLYDYARDSLFADIPVTANVPPTLLVQAENDNVDGVTNTLSYYTALKDAKVPVELHLYAEGRHGFGLRRTAAPITAWSELAEKWLHTIGMISP